MYRPSPQVTRPSPQAAGICFDSSAYIINLSGKQMENGAVDITWVFLLTVNMSLNTILWATSYSQVRQAHPKEEVEELVNKALDVLERCSERWPGTAAAAQLYAVFSRACLLSYDSRPESEPQSASSFASPPTISEPQSSPDPFTPASNSQQMPFLNPPQFGYVFDSPPESMNNYAFDPNYPPPQPTFRSNSIFRNPAADSSGRRFSYFPPDFTQAGDPAPDDPASSANAVPTLSPPDQLINTMPTPPDSNTTLSPPGMQTPLRQTNLQPAPLEIPLTTDMSPPEKPMPPQQQAHTNQGHPGQRLPNFTSVPPASQPSIAQRPLPAASDPGAWFNSTQPFIAPYNFGNLNNNFYNDALPGNPGFGDVSSGLGLQSLGGGFDGAAQFDMHPGRQGSLTQSQQLELMNVLETEGVGDIDAFLNAGNSMTDTNWF